MPNSINCFLMLPSHGLEDFPTHLHGLEAENLLAAWTAPWHPVLLTAAGKGPVFLRAGIDLITDPNSLVFIPSVANDLLNHSFYESASQCRATVIQSPSESPLSRQQMLDLAFQNQADLKRLASSIDAELIIDFFALAYAYLQVQLMTRQLRYSSNLDQELFDTHLLEAAESVIADRPTVANSKLLRCFELLLEEKNCYYPVEPQLLDLVLVSDETIGSSLERQFQQPHPCSIAIEGKTARRLDSQNRKLIDQLEQQLDTGNTSLAGGPFQEQPWPLLSSESELNQIALGQQEFHDLFNCQSSVYFQKQPGLHTNLPSTLEQLQFVGAIHATLDDRGLPKASSTDIWWNTPAGSGNGLPAIGDHLLNASEAGSLIGLGPRIGKQIDSDHNACIVFAHWPDHYCEIFRDFLRVQKFHPVLGKWKTLDQYFQSVYESGYGDHFDPNDYRFPFHLEALEKEQPDPISRNINYWRTHFQILNWQGLLAQTVLGSPLPNSQQQTWPEGIKTAMESLQELERLRDEFYGSPPTPMRPILSRIESLKTKIQIAIQQIYSLTIENASLDNSSKNEEFNSIDPYSDETVSVDYSTPTALPLLAFNGLNFKRTVRIITNRVDTERIERDKTVQFVDSNSAGTTWLLQLPGNSQLSLPSEPKLSIKPQKSQPAIIDQLNLRNEFFEVTVDPNSGGLSSISPYNLRRSVASQRLGIRLPNARSLPGHQPQLGRYATMICDDIQYPPASSVTASIVTHGHLIDGTEKTAKFIQTMTMTRGLPWIEIDIELDLLIPLTPSPFHYACNRIAWRNESAQLSGNFQESHHPVLNEWFYCPLFYRTDDGEHNVTVLTGGLPFHRRVGRRMVDSLLKTHQESQSRFRLAIGLDIDYPVMTAASWMTEPILLSGRPDRLEEEDCKWFIHLDRKNILVTWWKPQLDDAGQPTGLLFRCQETEGRSGELNLRFSRPVISATRVDFLGTFLQRLHSVTPTQFSLHINRYERFQIELKL